MLTSSRPLLLLAASLLLGGCGGSGGGGLAAGLALSESNDGYAGSGATFQAGFVAGEAAGATLGPVDRAFQVMRVRFLFGGATGSGVVTLRIHPDTGAAEPGAAVYTGDFVVTASDTAMQELDLTGSNVTLPAGRFRVAIGFNADAPPTVALDGDGTTAAGRNWILAGGSWALTTTYGVSGDWIIRADVVTR